MNAIRLVLVVMLIVGSVNALVGAIGSVEMASASRMNALEEIGK